MHNEILIAATIVGALLVLGFRLAGYSNRHTRTRERRTGFGGSNPFHAVSIQPAAAGCGAVELIRLRRFLSEEAPGLPLAECGAEDCGCKYIHHVDRRSGARDRRFDTAGSSEEKEFWHLRNRRVMLGRRHYDWQSA